MSLITAAVVHWNIVYLDRVVQRLRAQGTTVPDDLLAHVGALGWEHITLTGDYVWTAPDPAMPFRPLREVHDMFKARRLSVQFWTDRVVTPTTAARP